VLKYAMIKTGNEEKTYPIISFLYIRCTSILANAKYIIIIFGHMSWARKKKIKTYIVSYTKCPGNILEYKTSN
jgi:hypothetical protein